MRIRFWPLLGFEHFLPLYVGFYGGTYDISTTV